LDEEEELEEEDEEVAEEEEEEDDKGCSGTLHVPIVKLLQIKLYQSYQPCHLGVSTLNFHSHVVSVTYLYDIKD